MISNGTGCGEEGRVREREPMHSMAKVDNHINGETTSKILRRPSLDCRMHLTYAISIIELEYTGRSSTQISDVLEYAYLKRGPRFSVRRNTQHT